MKKLKMARGVTLTFEEGCNRYLENCRQRNLREGTINHYPGRRVRFLVLRSFIGGYSFLFSMYDIFSLKQ